MTIWFVQPADLEESEHARELIGGDYGGVPASVILVDAAPGQGPGLHKHPYAELFFVIDGEATFSDGTDERIVRAGEVVIVSPDQPHGFVNSGTGRLRQIDVHLSSRFVTKWLKEDALTDYVATAETDINAPAGEVWAALTDPEQIKEYMFGSQVVTEWKPGGPIVWKGEYEGKTYEDKGEVLEIEPERRLKVTHFSPLSGQEDRPENYHTVLYELEEREGRTHLSLTQDKNPSEEAAEHSRANWERMLAALKQVVERG